MMSASYGSQKKKKKKTLRRLLHDNYLLLSNQDVNWFLLSSQNWILDGHIIYLF